MNLSLRQKLLLLVLLPFILLGVFTFDKISSEKNRIEDMEAVRERMNQLERISALTHELQKERDFAVKFLVNPLLSAETQLNKQLSLTDSVIEDYASYIKLNKVDSSNLQLLRSFNTVRKSLTGYSYGPDEVNTSYNQIIAHYLDLVAEVGSEINTPLTKEEMKAYLALAESKESLSKIRNAINKALVFGMFQELEYGIFSGDKGVFEYNLNLFMKHSPENFKARFKLDLEGGTILNTIQIIDYCFESQSNNLTDYTSTDWWISATGTINLLHEQELFVLNSIKSSLVQQEAELRDDIDALYLMLSAVLFGLLLLVAIIARSITHPLKNIELVAEKLRYGQTDVNVQVKNKDEISKVAKAFNAMAKNADRMAKAAKQIGEGDYDVDFEKRSEGDVFGSALLNMRDNLKAKTTALKKNIEELEEANKYKSEFLANMSHELRTPLNSMLILASLLKENSEGNLTAEQQEYIAVIHQSGNNLLELINDILDLSKMEAGKLKVDLIEMNLFTLIKQIHGLFLPVAEENKLSFNIIQETELPEIIISDDLRLGQILKNLLSNALKFTPSGGRVTLLVGYSNGALKLTVSDTGVGIPKDKQSNIFGAFNQVDGSTSRNYGGTGLGLSITANLVELLHGEISLKSEVNEGSVFVVTLPLHNTNEQELKSLPSFKNKAKQLVDNKAKKEDSVVSQEKPVLTSSAQQKTDLPKIILTDDDISNVFLLAGELNAFDWGDAGTTEELLTKISEGADLIVYNISSLGMPDKDVIESLKNKNIPMLKVGDGEKVKTISEYRRLEAEIRKTLK